MDRFASDSNRNHEPRYNSRRMEDQIDEAEREDFARIKWIKRKKENRQASSRTDTADSGDDPPNIFTQYEDPDLIF